MSKPRNPNSNVHFFITIVQKKGLRLIHAKGEKGLEHGVLPTITENKLVEKNLASFHKVKVRGKYITKLFLTPKGEYVRKL